MTLKNNIKIFFVLIIFSATFFSGCIESDSPKSVNCQSGYETKKFIAADIAAGTYYELVACKYAEGNNGVVYVADDQASRITPERAQRIVQEFDDTIYPALTPHYGPPSDVDGNGKVIILCLDISDGGSVSGGYIAGFFDSFHIFEDDYSNKADMVFMDSYETLGGADYTDDFTDFNNTLAHEYSHLVQFNKQVLTEGSPYTETWINEGLADLAIHLVYGEIESQVAIYSQDPLGEIRTGLPLTNWQGNVSSYAQAYMFMAYVKGQAGDAFTSDFLNLVGDSAEGDLNNTLISLTGNDFPTTFENWLIASVVQDFSGVHSYNDVITTLNGPPLQDAGVDGINLEPYASAFFTYNSVITPDGSEGGNIKYVGVDGNWAVDLNGTDGYDCTSFGTLISYNSSTNYRSGASEWSGPGIGAWKVSSSSHKKLKSVPIRFPVPVDATHILTERHKSGKKIRFVGKK